MVQLKQLYNYQQEQKAELGSKWQGLNRIFINQYSGALNLREPYNWFKKI